MTNNSVGSQLVSIQSILVSSDSKYKHKKRLEALCLSECQLFFMAFG